MKHLNQVYLEVIASTQITGKHSIGVVKSIDEELCSKQHAF